MVLVRYLPPRLFGTRSRVLHVSQLTIVMSELAPPPKKPFLLDIGAPPRSALSTMPCRPGGRSRPIDRRLPRWHRRAAHATSSSGGGGADAGFRRVSRSSMRDGVRRHVSAVGGECDGRVRNTVHRPSAPRSALCRASRGENVRRERSETPERRETSRARRRGLGTRGDVSFFGFAPSAKRRGNARRDGARKGAKGPFAWVLACGGGWRPNPPSLSSPRLFGLESCVCSPSSAYTACVVAAIRVGWVGPENLHPAKLLATSRRADRVYFCTRGLARPPFF